MNFVNAPRILLAATAMLIPTSDAPGAPSITRDSDKSCIGTAFVMRHSGGTATTFAVISGVDSAICYNGKPDYTDEEKAIDRANQKAKMREGNSRVQGR